MAKKITFDVEVNPSGMHKGLALMERAAAASNEKMRREVYAAERRQLARPISETFRTGGGAGGAWGARRNFGASSSMFVSVARDSAASLASGAPITQVIAQQAPQVLQALSMMRLGMVAVGIAAAGVGAFITYKIVRGLYDAYIGTEQLQKGFRDVGLMSDRLANKIESKLIAALRAAANASKNLRREKSEAEFGLSAGDAKASLETAVERNLYLQKSNHTLEEQIEHEKKLLEIQARRADAAVDLAKKEMASKIEVADASEKLLKIQQDVDKQDEAMRAAENQRFGLHSRDSKGELWTAQSIQAAQNEDQKRMDALLDELKNAKKDLELAKLKNGQPEIDEKSAAALEIRNRMMELGVKADVAPSRVGSTASSGDSLVRVGNFLGTARGKIETLAQKQVEILQRIEMNTRPKGTSATYSP
jgi:hypothetical protein